MARLKVVNPSISVVIPTYNRAHMLKEALISVFNQTMIPGQIIVVDDGSTDSTQDVLREFGTGVITIFSDHRGVSASRNLGWRAARGQWIAFLDSDDLWLPRKLQRQWEALRGSPDYSVCYTDEVWLRCGKRVNPCKHHAKFSGWIFLHSLPRCIISPSSVLLRKEILAELGGFDETLEVCEDYDLWLRLTARYPVLYVPEKLIVKRGGHEGQLSKSLWGLDRFRIRALCKVLGDRAVREEYRVAALEELRRKCSIYAQGARKRGKLKEAMYYEALAQIPLDGFP